MAGADVELLEHMARELIYETVRASANARVIIVGDIHGCFDELTELLARIEPRRNDLVVSVGDIVTKGPAPAKCLDFWRERGYRAVRGNNEMKLLGESTSFLRIFAHDSRDVLKRRDLLRFIASWPLVIDIASHDVAVVHGGFLPQMHVTPDEVEREKDLVHHLRWIRKSNGGWKYVPKEKRRKGDVLWSEKWRGDRFVVYGHTPLRAPKFDRCALGLDTGCVYGGSLTAAILENGKWKTVSVEAKKKYAE